MAAVDEFTYTIDNADPLGRMEEMSEAVSRQTKRILSTKCFNPVAWVFLSVLRRCLETVLGGLKVW